jgi:threonine dehydratase
MGAAPSALRCFSATQARCAAAVWVAPASDRGRGLKRGSGIGGLISARDALGLKTKIIGVVAERANCYALSFAAGRPVETPSADTLADGMAVRVPVPEALEVILRGAERIVEVSEAEITAAMRHLFDDTHNLAEGAGAAPLAALLKEGAAPGGRYGVVLSGGNVDRALYAAVLGGA